MEGLFNSGTVWKFEFSMTDAWRGNISRVFMVS
jgi:hypothetical protein